MKKMVDWSQPPPEILVLIAERINSIADYVRFGAVCQSWRFVILDQRRLKFSSKTLPWLMIPRSVKDELEDGSLISNPIFFSLLEDKYYKFELPKARRYCLIGSPHGWLVLFSRENLEIYNPLTCVRIPLPLPYQEYEDYNNEFFRLVMPCSTISPKDQVILVLNCFRSLSFISVGDLAWTVFKKPEFKVEDMVLLNNVVYIIDMYGLIRCFDVKSPNPVITEFVQAPDNIEHDEFTLHLVELLGQLHLVVKYNDFRMCSEKHHFVTGSRAFDMDRVYHFRVFKFDFATNKWKELFTLGNYTIFVGRNFSISVRATCWNGSGEDPDLLSCERLKNLR